MKTHTFILIETAQGRFNRIEEAHSGPVDLNALARDIYGGEFKNIVRAWLMTVKPGIDRGSPAVVEMIDITAELRPMVQALLDWNYEVGADIPEWLADFLGIDGAAYAAEVDDECRLESVHRGLGRIVPAYR